jgi:peptidyl-prolyl cis-trans isomerase B (cyclophilin B)
MRRAVPLVLALLTAALLAGCSVPGRGGESTSTVQAPAESTAAAPTLKPGADGCDHHVPPYANEKKPTYTEPLPDPLVPPTATWTVTMITSCGPITMTLDPTIGGAAASSFAALARSGFYDGLTFHRVVPGFVVQGGDPDGNGSGGPGYTVDAAPPTDYRYSVGDVAMAKAGNEPAGAAGSQFFIVSTESGGAQLQPLYAVVGHVTDATSAETLKKIDKLGVADGPPVEPVYIWTARLTSSAAQ